VVRIAYSRLAIPETPRVQACSPAALTPFRHVRPLDPEVGVAAVAGVDHGVVRQYVEHALLQVVHQRVEVLLRAGLTGTPREGCRSLTGKLRP